MGRKRKKTKKKKDLAYYKANPHMAVVDAHVGTAKQAVKQTAKTGVASLVAPGTLGPVVSGLVEGAIKQKKKRTAARREHYEKNPPKQQGGRWTAEDAKQKRAARIARDREKVRRREEAAASPDAGSYTDQLMDQYASDLVPDHTSPYVEGLSSQEFNDRTMAEAGLSSPRDAVNPPIMTDAGPENYEDARARIAQERAGIKAKAHKAKNADAQKAQAAFEEDLSAAEFLRSAREKEAELKGMEVDAQAEIAQDQLLQQGGIAGSQLREPQTGLPVTTPQVDTDLDSVSPEAIMERAKDRVGSRPQDVLQTMTEEAFNALRQKKAAVRDKMRDGEYAISTVNKGTGKLDYAEARGKQSKEELAARRQKAIDAGNAAKAEAIANGTPPDKAHQIGRQAYLKSAEETSQQRSKHLLTGGNKDTEKAVADLQRRSNEADKRVLDQDQKRKEAVKIMQQAYQNNWSPGEVQRRTAELYGTGQGDLVDEDDPSQGRYSMMHGREGLGSGVNKSGYQGSSKPSRNTRFNNRAQENMAVMRGNRQKPKKFNNRAQENMATMRAKRGLVA